MCVSTRALDGVYGRPAAGVPARLERFHDDAWELVAHGKTDADGRITEWAERPFVRGAHRIVLETDHYFAGLGITAAYPEIAVAFRVVDGADACLVHVMLAPSTYSMHFEIHG